MRGFEVCKGFEDKGVILPKRSTKGSAGYDFFIIEDLLVKPGFVELAKTGVKVYMMEDEVLKIYPRSSLAVKRGLTLPNNVGIIDSDYYGNLNNDGHILIAVYNFSDKDVLLKKGDKIAQGIFVKYLTVDNEEDILTTRTGGYGSTGNK